MMNSLVPSSEKNIDRIFLRKNHLNRKAIKFSFKANLFAFFNFLKRRRDNTFSIRSLPELSTFRNDLV